jgi:hypothetical protein
MNNIISLIGYSEQDMYLTGADLYDSYKCPSCENFVFFHYKLLPKYPCDECYKKELFDITYNQLFIPKDLCNLICEYHEND